MDNIKPWTNDEIELRINMLTQYLIGITDDLLRIQCEREIATWRELTRRRFQ